MILLWTFCCGGDDSRCGLALDLLRTRLVEDLYSLTSRLKKSHRSLMAQDVCSTTSFDRASLHLTWKKSRGISNFLFLFFFFFLFRYHGSFILILMIIVLFYGSIKIQSSSIWFQAERSIGYTLHRPLNGVCNAASRCSSWGNYSLFL